ncbi:hypothetical protein ACIQF6_23010 [Kitasatospora sp. NPDC092948]|uniref:hypothetical protein n=1 Tax=Kitasatospora sp. NPDC092948 TaxID=3364088 RepID=UPI00380C0EA0
MDPQPAAGAAPTDLPLLRVHAAAEQAGFPGLLATPGRTARRMPETAGADETPTVRATGGDADAGNATVRPDAMLPDGTFPGGTEGAGEPR